MPLTDLKCKNTKPTDKPQKLSDSGGLYLHVMPNGAKYWRMKYRIHGKEKLLALGVYVYHLSTIAEFLNNIRWGIYFYTRKFFKESYKPYWDDTHKMDAYKYEIPPEISNKYIRTICWDLLNDVMREPYFPRFTVTDSLKSVY